MEFLEDHFYTSWSPPFNKLFERKYTQEMKDNYR